MKLVRCNQKIKVDFILSKSIFGCLVFLMLFPLDTVAQILENSMGVVIPIGMLGILLSAMLSVFIFLETGLALLAVLVNLFLILVFETIVLGSSYGDFIGFYTFLKAFFVVCVGYYLGAFLFYSDREKFQFSFFLLFFILFFVVFFGSLKGLNYLRLADGFSLFAFLFISRFRSQFYVLTFVLLSVIALYLIGARFALLGFVLSSSVLIWLRLSQVKKFFYPVFIIAAVISLYYLGSYYFSTQVAMRNNRFVRLIYDSDSDGSFTERISQFLLARDTIINNLFFGEYKYYEGEGLVGAYAHNFISYWAEFGVFGFLYSFGLVLTSAFVLFVRTKINKSWAYDFVVVVNVYFLSGFAIAKSYHWLVIYLVIGINLFFIASYWPLIRERVFVSCKKI